jgi:hypothetical protein
VPARLYRAKIVVDLARDPLRLEIGAPERGVDRHCPERRLKRANLRVANLQHADGQVRARVSSFWIAIE